MDNIERWVLIKASDRHFISSFGRVLGLRGLLKPKNNGRGYFNVSIGKKHFYIHRLVADAFIKNPNNLKEVNHKDLNKSNNRLSNLEWCSRKYNVNHAHENGAYDKAKAIWRLNCGDRHKNSKISDADAIEIRRRYKKRIVTAKFLAKEYGVGFRTILLIVNGNSRKHLWRK